jgi:hypothetical protein
MDSLATHRSGGWRRGGFAGAVAAIVAVLVMAMAAPASAASPTITKLKPNSGPVTGGTTVMITGSEFTGATAVSFGSTNATSFTVVSATSITAVSPPEPSGMVDVTVTTPEGTSAISSLDRFKFAPTITNVNPSAGRGGTMVTVTGAGFATGTSKTTFRFGKALGAVVNCGSSTTCTVVAPALAAGTVDVKVTVNKVTSTLSAPADQFTYVSPEPNEPWDVTEAFAEHPEQNPLPDQFGHPAVWSWMYGEADTPSTYLLMEHRFLPANIAKQCSGTEGFYERNKGPTLFTLPAVIYNAGPTVERGHTGCAPSAEYPTKTFFMHPDNKSSLAAVVRWKSPITGTVTVSGSVQPTDTSLEGIDWQLDQGSTILIGPTGQADNSLTSFGPMTVSVTAGESLYFDVGREGDGFFDTTAVTLDIAP